MIRAFVDLVKQNARPGMVVCEVGCFDGETTEHYAQTVKDYGGRIILIDWFRGNVGSPPEARHGYRPDDANVVFARLQNRLATWWDIVTVWRGHSAAMSLLVDNESVDICFIDADHHYAAVKDDIHEYLKKVKPGGLLCGHDCEQLPPRKQYTDEELKHDWDGQHLGVIQAVWEAFGATQLLDDLSGEGVPLWIHRKPNA